MCLRPPEQADATWKYHRMNDWKTVQEVTVSWSFWPDFSNACCCWQQSIVVKQQEFHFHPAQAAQLHSGGCQRLHAYWKESELEVMGTPPAW